MDRTPGIKLACMVAGLVVASAASHGAEPEAKAGTDATSRPTFGGEVAPVIYRHCLPCHLPGQSGPFSLVTYAQVRKQAPQILEVVEKRVMPPWLPAADPPMVDERRLSEREIELIRSWVKNGLREGEPPPTPPPAPEAGWLLGKPDLVVTMPQTYQLAADGPDVYRNFVFPIPTTERRWIKGVEFHPGNPRVVHHAFVNVDETPVSRRLAARSDPPGIDGMALPDTAHMPGGQFLGWQPGKRAKFAPEGLGWVLNPGTDLVLQLHLNPSGKPEPVQSSVAFYFTDQPPTNQPVRLNLTQLFLDLPPGATNYTVEQAYALPVDVRVLGVSAHTHYLGKELEGRATLPDGSTRGLFLIPRWDFNWQGDYRYATPIELPKGTRMQMRFAFDNSTNNFRNPSRPPRRVTYGLQSTDEMAELWFQVLPRNPQERETLLRDFHAQLSRWSLEYNLHLVQADPSNAVARTRVGRALHYQGDIRAALQHLVAAVKAKPDYDRGRYELGFLLLRQNQLPLAQAQFEEVVRLNPDDYEAEGSLGWIHLKAGRFSEAKTHLERALAINPKDAIARSNLRQVDEHLGGAVAKTP